MAGPGSPMETKKTPPWLLALGRDEPPPEIEIERGVFRLDHIFKHDFFAFTARYVGVDQSGSVILKIGRTASFFGLPLSWIGRLHAWHESRVFRQLEDLETVPAFTGRYGKYGMTHEFVEGHELAKGERVPDAFFPRLEAAVTEIHRRKMAYVDLEKCENVLVGDDGHPYLFDFQISWYWPESHGGDLLPLRWLRARFQQGDRYHLLKLKRRTRPDLMSEEELAASRRRPLPVRIHSTLVRPLTKLRRRILNRIDPVKNRGERGRQRSPKPDSR